MMLKENMMTSLCKSLRRSRGALLKVAIPSRTLCRRPFSSGLYSLHFDQLEAKRANDSGRVPFRALRGAAFLNKIRFVECHRVSGRSRGLVLPCFERTVETEVVISVQESEDATVPGGFLKPLSFTHESARTGFDWRVTLKAGLMPLYSYIRWAWGEILHALFGHSDVH